MNDIQTPIQENADILKLHEYNTFSLPVITGRSTKGFSLMSKAKININIINFHNNYI